MKKILILLLLLSATASSQANIFGKVFAKSLQIEGVAVDSTYFSGGGFGKNKKNRCNNMLDLQVVLCYFHGTLTNRFSNRTITQVTIILSTYGCQDDCTLYQEDKINLLKFGEEIPPGTKRTFQVKANYNKTPSAMRVATVVKVKGYK